MFIFSYLIVIILGLYLGSFLTAISLRLASEQKLFSKHSFCDSCHARIKFTNLIPVVGYLLTKGKCSNCKSEISVKYTIWEVVHCIAFVLNFAAFHNSPLSLIFFALLTAAMFVIAIVDCETMFVYHIHIAFFGFFLFLFLYEQKLLDVTPWSCAAASAPPLFKLVYEYIREKITKERLTIVGWGDVYIFIILFFLLDFLNISIIMMISGLCGVFFGLARKSGKNAHYPFIPSISLAVYTIFIWKFL